VIGNRKNKIKKRNFTYYASLSFGLSIAFLIGCVNANEATTQKSNAIDNKLVLENCHLEGIREQVKCGKLTVPENYSKPANKKIQINFAVLPAIDNSEQKTPFMFLAGGPGQAAVELAAPLYKALTEIRKSRDLILIDQRGTGKSNPLTCEEVEVSNVYELSQKDFSAKEVKQCLTQLIAADPERDFSQYNSENAIRDFDAVRAALGHQQVNIYGGSYGTRAALVYMRMFPQSLRSVVLDSVGPIEVPIGTFGQSSARSFKLLLEHCQQEAACKEAFPQLRTHFQELVEHLTAQAQQLEIAHPRLGTKTTFVVDKDKLIANLRMQLYSIEMRSLVPLVIEQAYQQNYMPFAGLVAQNDGGMGMYMGLTFNIVCNEDYPRISDEMWAKDADNEFGKDNSHLAWKIACPLWPKYRPSEAFYQPVSVNIPTLIFSGNLDPVTPPSNGEYPAKSLPNSHHIIIENAAHTVLGTCATDIINEFLTTLSPKSLDESCLDDISPESFMTNLNGSL
jgi:pimeloyl-ACP methyl ester carboxylesterase